MWRSQTSRKGRQLINAARQLTTESAPPKPNIPPPFPPPQQPPRPKSAIGGLIKFVAVSVPLAAGGVVGYAWYDRDFRKQVEDNVPYAKEVFEQVLPQDEKPSPVVKSKQGQIASTMQQASLDEQRNAAMNKLQDPVSKSAAVGDLYTLAHCSAKEEKKEEKKEKIKLRRFKRKTENAKNKLPEDSQYLSYIPPSFGKDSSVPENPVTVTLSDDDCASDHDDDDNVHQSNVNDEEGSEDFSIPPKHKNPFDGMEDLEKRLTQEIMASKSNPLYDLTGPEKVQMQSYHARYAVRTSTTSSTSTIDQMLIDDNNDSESARKSVETGPSTQKGTTKQPDKIDPSAIEAQVQKREDDDKADNAALEVVIHKLLTNSEKLTEEAVKAQQEVADTIRNHTKLLKQAMDDTADILQKDSQWEAVAIANKEREHAVTRASGLVTESKKSIEKLRNVLADGKNNKVTQYNPAIVPASKKVNNLLKDIGSANLMVRQAESESNVMQKYKDLVEKGKKQFQMELESLMPNGKLSTGKKLSEDELNALIAHAHRRIEQLQKQVAEHQALERQRLTAALDAQRSEDAKLTSAAVAEERLHLQEDIDAEKAKQEMEFLVRLETEVRKQLARQAAAHSDHLKDVLAVQHEQLNIEFNRELNAKVLEERESFQTEVASWISRLKGIEAAIDARAASEKLARCAQDLWLACISLNSVILFGSESEDEKSLVPLKKSVDSVLNAGNKHVFVETVANSFPETALNEGVSTEDDLRHRFSRVARICRRVGLVTSDNKSLYKFLISYLHSFVVFDSIDDTSEKAIIDLNSLDNFAILAHAQYWIDRGNLNLAVRFMNQLTGEARKAASDWVRDARHFLETRQVAYTLTAYASATGLANTF